MCVCACRLRHFFHHLSLVLETLLEKSGDDDYVFLFFFTFFVGFISFVLFCWWFCPRVW